MCESPDFLKNICVKFVAGNLNAIFFHVNDRDGYVHYILRDGSFCFPQNISELLFETLSEKTLTDKLMTIFESPSTRLKRVFIQDASKLSSRGLRCLKFHKISELTTIKLTAVTVNDLIGCLGEWTLHNLHMLNVSQSTFLNTDKVRVVMALSKLKNLRCLDVSSTEFNSQGLEIVSENLPFLESINISCTMVSDISPLRKCKSHLLYLSMYNVKTNLNFNLLPVLSDLSKLEHLDISVDDDESVVVDSQHNPTFSEIAESLSNLHHLASLDISGRKVSDVEMIKSFLTSHKHLKFLGLMDCRVCQNDIFCNTQDPMFNENLVVTGNGTEQQILDSLYRYMQRRVFMEKSLYFLYSVILNIQGVRLDIIKVVITAMKKYPQHIRIQTAATACLYNLTKGDLSSHIHVFWLENIIDLTLKCMEIFSNQPQLQKNALLILCADRMLQDVTFDRYHCAELVMNSLITYNDPAMTRMSVAICSVLAAQISTVQTSNLGAKKDYMVKLLDIIKSKLSLGERDTLMKFTLSALWNLTDESPRTCGVFLELGGLQLFIDVLDKFSGDSSVVTKVLGLMNNVAEVSTLRMNLQQTEFIHTLRYLLHCNQIDVSYFAAGIIAHIVSDGEEFWTCASFTWREVTEELGLVILGWEMPKTEMVAYRSFNPFYPLFFCFHVFQVQLWAAWAVHHVCLKNPKRYCKMILEEGGVDILVSLVKHPSGHKAVSNFCLEIISFVKHEFPNIDLPCI